VNEAAGGGAGVGPGIGAGEVREGKSFALSWRSKISMVSTGIGSVYRDFR
jgi:hypothetical protein